MGMVGFGWFEIFVGKGYLCWMDVEFVVVV